MLRVALAFFLLLVAPASAGTLAVDGTVLRYTGAPGETNDMDMSSDGSFVQIGDTAGVTAGPGCTQVGAAARCSLAGVGSFVVSLGDGDDVARGVPGLDGRLEGGPGDDHVLGDSGDEELDGGPGADTFAGGDGFDIVDHSTRTTRVMASIGFVPEPGEEDAIGADVEGLRGGPGDDRLSGSPGDDWFDGGPGGDDIRGGTGFDTVSYVDRTVGVSRGGQLGEFDSVNDDVESILGGSGDDRLTGTTADDLLVGGAGDDVIDGYLGDDELDGGPGTDVVSYATHLTGVTVDLPAGAAGGLRSDERDTLRSFEGIVGTQDIDRLYGDDGNNVLLGGSGADLLYGGGGRDTLDGASGADTILAADGTIDTVECGLGADRVDADLEDAPAPDCESVHRPPQPQPPSPTPTPTPEPPPADTTAPRATLRAAAQRWPAVRRTGLKVRVDCREACTIVGTVRLSARDARRHQLRGTIGRSAEAFTTTGRRTVTIRLTRAALRRLRTASAPAFTLTVTAADRAGNTRTIRRAVRLRR